MTAEAVTADGLQAQNQATTRVERGKLHVVLRDARRGAGGRPDPGPRRGHERRAGAGRERDRVAQFDSGLTHASGRTRSNSGRHDRPGQTKTLDLPLTAKATGRYGVRATATADGNVVASAEAVTVDVRRAELKLAVAGPTLAYLNQEFTWTVAVGNTRRRGGVERGRAGHAAAGGEAEGRAATAGSRAAGRSSGRSRS